MKSIFKDFSYFKQSLEFLEGFLRLKSRIFKNFWIDFRFLERI